MRKIPIYFWDQKKVEEQFIQGTISERVKAYYFLVYSLVLILIMYTAVEVEWTTLLFLEFLLVSLITIWGIHWSYKANGGDQGSHFIERFMVIGFPLAIKVFAIALLAIFTIGFYVGFAGVFSGSFDESAMGNLVDMSILPITVLTQVLFYKWMSDSLHRIRTGLQGAHEG